LEHSLLSTPGAFVDDPADIPHSLARELEELRREVAELRLRDRDRVAAEARLQGLIEELAAQEEELRNQNEELQAAHEELKAQEEELLSHNEELREAYDSLAKSEENLRLSEERFRLAFFTSPDSININRQEDGIYVEINPGFTRLTGYERREVIGRSSLELNIWDDPADRARLVESLKKHGHVDNMEARFRLKDGSVSTGLMSAAVITVHDEPHIISITRDIEEMVRARRELEASERKFRTLFSQALNPILIVDQGGHYLDANQAALDFLECSLGELRHKVVWDWAPPGKEKRALEEHSPFLHPRTVETDYLVNGQIKTLLLNVVPVKGVEGTSLYGIGQDVTERKRLREKVLQSQKLESLGVVAGGVAHDFNNLLMGIMGYADLALEELAAGSSAADNVRQLRAVAQRAAQLTQQMLAYSGKGRFVNKAIDLSKAVREMSPLLEAALTSHNVLELDLASGLPAMEGDPGQINQVIMNLIHNAAEAYGDKGGVIRVCTGERIYRTGELSASYLYEDQEPGSYVFLEVSDQGCGIDLDHRQRIFDPFFTTKFTGRGLGLAAVLGIVRGHRGAIILESAPDKGSCFRVLFPAGGSKNAAAEQEPEQLPPGQMLQGTVLVVDDKADVREVATVMLSRAGMRVLSAADGSEALDIFSAMADEIDVVLLDLTMPGMDGEEVLEELKKRHCRAPVVLSSGYTQQHINKRLNNKEVAAFIQKPYRKHELLNCLQEVMTGKRGER